MARSGNLKLLLPESVEDFKKVVLDNHKVRLCGASGSGLLGTSGYSGVLDFRPNDLVIQVKSGTLMLDLLAEVSESGLTLPLAGEKYGLISHSTGTVGGWLARGLPHLNEGVYGSIRDWVTGMTVMLGDGNVVRMGSNVVKSVSGYDMHRMMVGSRGELGLILDVTLRLRSAASLSQPNEYWSGQKDFLWISRLPLAEFEEVANSVSAVVAADCKSGLVWSEVRPTDKRVIWSMDLDSNVFPGPNESVMKIRRRLKEQIDPYGRFE